MTYQLFLYIFFSHLQLVAVLVSKIFNIIHLPEVIAVFKAQAIPKSVILHIRP